MERPVENAIVPQVKASGNGPAPHLMCGTPFWGIAAFVACGYFAYAAYAQLREGDFHFQHGLWTLITWAIWVILLAGLVFDTNCLRERIFFSVLLTNFVLGFVLAAWTDAPNSTVHIGREISLALWIIAALASLRTVRNPTGEISKPRG